MEFNSDLCFSLIDGQLKCLNKILVYVTDMHNSLEVLDWNKVRRLEGRMLRSWSKFKTNNKSLISHLTSIGSIEAEEFISKLIDGEIVMRDKLSRRNGSVLSILRSELPDVHLLFGELGDLISKGVNVEMKTLNKLSRFLHKEFI